LEKYKAIYLNDNGLARIQSVYSIETHNAIDELVDLDEKVYTKSDLRSLETTNTQIIFSTWGMPKLSEEEIRRYFPNLKIVFYAAGSVHHFATPFLNCGVRVVSAWAANAVPVAEFTFAQIILANKGYFLAQQIMKEQGYNAARQLTDQHFNGTYGCTVGIIGAGMIGQKVIELLNICNLRVKILVYDPFLNEDTATALGVTLCSLEELFEKSHVVSNHLANNSQTVGILNYELFKRMKPSTTFINTGRGAQVVESDLVRALNEFPNRSALLDVTDPEPPEKEHPFFTMHNVFLTSHISGSIGDETYRMADFMLEELELYLSSQKLKYEVTAKMLEVMA